MNLNSCVNYAHFRKSGHKYLCHNLILVLMGTVGVTVYNGSRTKRIIIAS